MVDLSEVRGVLPDRQSAWLDWKCDLNADQGGDRTAAVPDVSQLGATSFSHTRDTRDSHEIDHRGLMSDHMTPLGGTCSARFDPLRELFTAKLESGEDLGASVAVN